MTTNLSEKNDHGLLLELLKETQINGEYLKGIHTLLSDLKFLLDGFTNQGASINGYVPDIGTLAYLSVVGPTLARKLEKTIGVEEILKGGVPLAQRMVEEFSAYQSTQQPQDRLANALEFLNYKEDTPNT
jgi:hypothetical protein